MAKFKKRYQSKFPVNQAVRDQIIRDREQKRVLKHQVRSTQPITELTKEVVLPSLDLVQKELCLRKLSEFIKYFWNVLEPSTNYSQNWHIESICLPGNAKVTTEVGDKSISDIVENRLKVKCLSWNHSRREFEWRPIKHWFKNQGKPILRIKTSDGDLRCTGNHPVYLAGVGYVSADKIKSGDKLRMVRKVVSEQPIKTREVLLQKMFCSGKNKDRHCLHGLREDVGSPKNRKRNAVPGVLGKVKIEGANLPVCSVQKGNIFESSAVFSGKKEIRGVLQSGLFFQVYDCESRESALETREVLEPASAGVCTSKKKGVEERWKGMRALCKGGLFGCSSYKLEHQRQRFGQSDNFMSSVPLKVQASVKDGYRVVESTVLSVEREISVPREVYNLEIESNNNYFSDDFLVHNCEHLEAVASGQIRNLLINIPPRHMKPCYVKCKVLEKRRGRINLGDIVVGDEVLTHMGRFRKVSAVHEQGLLTLYKINTWRGRVAYAAEDHPFLTTRGWVLARDLTDKDFLAEVHPQEDCGTETVCDEEARLIGYLVGDGCVKYKNTAFTNQDSETLEDFLYCAEFLDFAYRRDVSKRGKNKPVVTIYLKPKGEGGFCPNHPDVRTDWKFNYCVECRSKKQVRINNGSKTSKKGFSNKRREHQYDTCECGQPKAKVSKKCYVCSGRSLDVGQFDDPSITEAIQNPVLSWLRTHDLFEKSSYTKVVPSSILAGTNKIISEFLAAYWSCDGTIAYRTDIRNKDNFTMKVESVTVSEQLAKGVQHLLTRLGISSVVRRQERKLKTKRQGDTYVFWRVTMTTQNDISKFMSVIGSKIRHEKKSRIKGLNRTDFDRVLTPDPIESIEVVNKGECRCLTVEEDHSFTLEDVAVKNTLSVSIFWPAWVWTKYPSKRWLFNSYDMKNSIRDSVACRRLIESPRYTQMFGDAFKITSDQNTKIRFDNDRSGYRIASSVNGANTGEGADILIVDDAHNVREKESEAVLESTLAWWFETMSSRLNDPKTGGKVVVGQRVREGDLPGAIIKKGGYVHLNLPAEFNPKAKCVTSLGWEDPRTKKGELLWPNRIGDKEIANLKKELGPTAYAAQYLQSPNPLEGGRFKEYYFRYYDIQSGCYRLFQKDGTTVKKMVDIESCNRFAMADPAGTEKSVNNKPCWTVIQVWDVTPDGDMVLVHQTRVQQEAPDVVSTAIKVVRQHECPYIAVEKDGLGLGVIQTIRRSGVAVKPVKARGSKEARSETAEIRMAAGTVYFGINEPQLFDIQNELLLFPNGSDCDIVDTLSHSAILVQTTKGPPLHGENQPDGGSADAQVNAFMRERQMQKESQEIREQAYHSARALYYDPESMWVGGELN